MSVLRRCTGVGAVLAVAVALAAGAVDQSRVLANLLKLHGEVVSMLYSSGALDRAAHVQERLAVLQKDVHDWSGIDLGLQGIVLSPEDWAALHLATPYGMPQRLEQGMAVPAWGDEQSVALWQRLLGQPLRWGAGEPLRGSKEEAESLVLADTLLQVECGREAAAHALATAGPDWVAELLAHVVATSAMAVHEQDRLEEVDSIYAALASRTPAPGPVTSFDAHANLDQRMAYQPLFHQGARIVLNKDGRKGARTLLKLPMSRGGQLTEGDLLKRYPELQSWLYGSAPAPSVPPSVH